jgi:hypothetical protein
MEGVKGLWCPVRKMYLSDRPEERVRLRVIEKLRALGYPAFGHAVEYQWEKLDGLT